MYRPNKYRYMLVDGSYFLTRNFMVLKNYDDFSFSGLAKSFTQSLVKIFRDFVSADKIIIAWDKWSKDANGYYRNSILSDYKGNRHYNSDEELERLKNDPSVSKDEIRKYEWDLKCNKIKHEVKDWILNELGNYGIPSIYVPGYEADDITKVFCEYLKDDNKKSCIVSKDSDWNYLINPNVDFINGKNGDVVCYSDMKSKSLPDDMTLFRYKSIEDSLYGSHNNMMPSIDKDKVKRQNHTKVIKRIIDGEVGLILDRDLYERNLSTFDIENFDNYDKLIEEVKSIDSIGSILDPDDFNEMCDKYKINLYDYYFFNNLCSLLNTDLYKGIKKTEL